ncbi:hypothetical protein Tco_1292116 [Tanacetum coccineum]
MGTKVTSSSGSVLEEPEIQKLQMQAKISKMLFTGLFDAHEGLFRSVLISKTCRIGKSNSEKKTCSREDSNLNYHDVAKVDERGQLQIQDSASSRGSIPSVSSSGDETKQFKFYDTPVETELEECKTNFDETSRALGEATCSRDSSLIALQTKQTADLRGQLKEKTKVILDLKVKEGKDIDTMIEMIPYDTSDPANRFCLDGEETVTLEKESRSKLDKDTVKPYNYTYQKLVFMKLSNTIKSIS